MSSDHDDARHGAPSAPDAWDPADGPAPSADELRDAGTLARALEARPASASASAESTRDAADAAVRDVLETALRARAVFADPADTRAREASRTAAKRAVDEVIAQRNAARFLSGRGRWLAIAAAGVFALGGAGLVSARVRMDGRHAAPLDEGRGISRPVGVDVFTEPLPERPGARVMDRLADARMRAYRDRVLLYGSARRAR